MKPESISIATPNPSISIKQKAALALIGIGLLLIFVAWVGRWVPAPGPMLWAALGSLTVGSLWFTFEQYRGRPAGISNNGVFSGSLTGRGILGWLAGIVFTGFYICLYWFPEFLGVVSGQENTGLARLFDPLSQWMQGRPANQWFVYGTFYTISVVLLGIKMLVKYRHNKYQQVRTASVMFFQTAFAFLLPAFLVSMQQPEIFFTYWWPLSYYQGTPQAFDSALAISTTTKLGLIFFFFSLFMFFIATPVLTYFFGKRWYCSWVCGCGGLAETAGDSFRQLSDKSMKAWKIERWMVHSVLLIVVAMTSLLWINVATGRSVLGPASENFYKTYSFLIGSAFSGVIGVGFYPILGNRVWCRFGCPMAAWLGIWQRKASKFRITTNGGQCISCGNCSTYCEMGIDVRAYAQQGQDILRASCVGCGICSAVCPRGVLKLENASGDIFERAEKKRVGFVAVDAVKKLS